MTTLNGKRILVVEDEAIIAAFVEDILDELGATVVGPAYSVAQALKLASAEALDAAILDVNVRDESIVPVRDTLRRREPHVLTGYGAERSREVTSGAPVVDKPYSKERISKALADCLAEPFPHSSEAGAGAAVATT
jgi:DNA-binding response OmpR family regulator